MSEIKMTAFGKNDIRGIYGEDITEELFFYVGLGYVEYLKNKTNESPYDIWIAVARDARTHSPALTKSLIKGINTAGANVLDIGLVPTPLGYYAEFANVPKDIIKDSKIFGSLIVTASHNPCEYNGLKMTFNKASLNEEEIKEVKELTMNMVVQNSASGRLGKTKTYDIIDNYTEKMSNTFATVGKGLKVVVDSANGTGGVVAPNLYKELGCEVIELYSEPDGNFPNHHPNPSDEKTLDDIKKAVIDNHADLGIAFDGDSDRIGVIDSQGNYLTGDKLLLIYALDVIESLSKRGETPTVISEVKCSQVLFDTINKNGGRAIMWKTGHGYIKSKMKEENAILAGEMSGHTFFKDRYYGFDDAVYAGCRIIEIIAKHKLNNKDFKIEDLLTPFNAAFTSKEVRFHCPNDLKKPTLNALKEVIENNKNIFGNEILDIVTIDGMRIIFNDGFALIRQSNTEPVFTLRFEAKSEKQCMHYQKVMLDELKECLKVKS